MDIIKLTDEIEEIVIKNDLVDTASVLKQEYAISKSSELQQTIKNMENENRILKLGILGRVKAGKSSLLNALVFDGEDVLPKAATPMTAALTILQYGNETKADVEFFNQEDIDDITQIAHRYERQLENIKKKEYEKLKKIRLKKERIDTLTNESEQEIQQKAINIAHRELKKDDNLSSSYEQYQKIKNSGVSLEEIEKYNSIKADNLEELNSQLLDFVGANGKYMPFTKSVTMTIQEDSLKDIQVIDTPGVNDPVVSREERTRELLKECDVVLIVSPSGQFLSSEDLDLMDRITSKEGIKELYLVASQVDNQLYGSEKENGNGILNNVLNGIGDKLTHQQRDVLLSLKNNSPEIGTIYDSLIDNRVIVSSGICYSIFKNFNNQNEWDSNMKHVWKLLNENYKDFFTDEETSLNNLKKLANVETIKSIFDKVREQKNYILAERKESFTKTKYKALIQYKEALKQDIKDQIQKVENTDIDELKKQKKSLESFKTKATDVTNEIYLDVVEQLEFDIKTNLQDKLKAYFKQSKKDLQESESIDTKTWKHDKKAGWWDVYIFEDRYETRSRTFATVKAGRVRTSLENLTGELESLVDLEAKQYVSNWRKEVIFKEIVSTLRNEVGDEKLDKKIIAKTIRNVLNRIIYPEISYDGNFPKALKKSGTLKESQAEQFIDEAYNYISNLKLRVKKDIQNYINSLIEILTQENIGKNIFARYIKDLEQLKNDIENKELSLARLNHLLKQLEVVDG